MQMIPRDGERDTLVFLGDLIDRGADAPGVVEDVIRLKREHSERVITLRGNHEQMLLDCIDERAPLWFSPKTGGAYTFEQYTGTPLNITTEDDLDVAIERISSAVPAEHIEFFRSMPFYYEDDYALYVHAGLDQGKHPRDMDTRALLWTRDMEFFKHYTGKPCLFGHTPTPFLPLRGRLGRHGIYIFHSAIGLDTGYDVHSPLSCLVLPDFILYQAFADGHTATHHITTLIPESLRAMQRLNGNQSSRSDA
jgi:calcineurin-like phosphoesterase family protein